jgi:hypothetical protein
MNTWLILVLVVAILGGAFLLRAATRGRERHRPGEHAVSPRDELARNAGIASFGLSLPWRRTRKDPGRHRSP